MILSATLVYLSLCIVFFVLLVEKSMSVKTISKLLAVSLVWWVVLVVFYIEDIKDK